MGVFYPRSSNSISLLSWFHDLPRVDISWKVGMNEINRLAMPFASTSTPSFHNTIGSPASILRLLQAWTPLEWGRRFGCLFAILLYVWLPPPQLSFTQSIHLLLGLPGFLLSTVNVLIPFPTYPSYLLTTCPSDRNLVYFDFPFLFSPIFQSYFNLASAFST